MNQREDHVPHEALPGARYAVERAIPLDPNLCPCPPPEPLVFRSLIRSGANDPAHRQSVLIDPYQRCPFGEIVGHLEAMQGILREHGLFQGDCVTAELSNSVCSALLILALLDGGYSVVIAQAAGSGRRREIEPPAAMRFSKAVVRILPEVGQLAPGRASPAASVEVRSNLAYDPAATAPHKDHPRIFTRTSGSLGSAKIVKRMYQRYYVVLLNVAARIPLERSMRMALPIPICHLFGLGTGLLLGVHRGVSIDLQEHPNVLHFLEREEIFDPDIAVVVPTFCEMLVRTRKKPRPYRFMIIGGDKINDATRSKSELLHGPLINSYASSEMGSIAISELGAPGPRTSASAGRLMPGVALRLLVSGNPGGETAPVGELELKTAYEFEGYVDIDGALVESAASFDDGWFRTGDLARLLPDDTLEILGRCDLSINRNGLLLPFADVEARLREITGVDDAVVVSGGEGIRGRVLAAACVMARGTQMSPQEVRDRYAARAPSYAVPDIVHFVDAFPLLPSGKIDRRVLADAIFEEADRSRS
jgi:acyl-CoA synthetase (AMP-forming)/AMP-acid ligase II